MHREIRNPAKPSEAKKSGLNENETLLLMTRSQWSSVIHCDETIEDIYEKYKSSDGFVYLLLCREP